MSKIIEEFFDFPKATTPEDMETHINASLRMSLNEWDPVIYRKLKLLDMEPFESRAEAVRYLKSENCIKDLNYGVLFYGRKQTKKTGELEEKKKKLINKLADYEQAHSIKGLKAQYIACPTCGSKLKRELLCDEKCPVPLCRKDLRSESVLRTIEKYRFDIFHLEEQIDSSFKKTDEIWWVVHGQIMCHG